jgi:hypothetical protein
MPFDTHQFEYMEYEALTRIEALLVEIRDLLKNEPVHKSDK